MSEENYHNKEQQRLLAAWRSLPDPQTEIGLFEKYDIIRVLKQGRNEHEQTMGRRVDVYCDELYDKYEELCQDTAHYLKYRNLMPVELPMKTVTAEELLDLLDDQIRLPGPSIYRVVPSSCEKLEREEEFTKSQNKERRRLLTAWKETDDPSTEVGLYEKYDSIRIIQKGIREIYEDRAETIHCYELWMNHHDLCRDTVKYFRKVTTADLAGDLEPLWD